MIRAVLFDLDGVLIDSIKIHCRTYIIAMQKNGLNPDVEKMKRLFGEKAEVIIRKSCNRKLSSIELKRILDEKNRLYEQELVREKPIMGGAREILEWCKQNRLKIGLGTGTRRKNVELFLEILGMNPFDAIVTASDVSNAKPDPEIWIKTLKKLDVPPENAVVLEDAILGIKAAKRAGLRVIALPGTFDEKALKSAGADWVVKNLNEAKKILSMLIRD